MNEKIEQTKIVKGGFRATLALLISVMSCFQLFNFEIVWGQSKAKVASSDTMRDNISEMPTITTLKSLVRSMQDL